MSVEYGTLGGPRVTKTYGFAEHPTKKRLPITDVDQGRLQYLMHHRQLHRHVAS